MRWLPRPPRMAGMAEISLCASSSHESWVGTSSRTRGGLGKIVDQHPRAMRVGLRPGLHAINIPRQLGLAHCGHLKRMNGSCSARPLARTSNGQLPRAGCGSLFDVAGGAGRPKKPHVAIAQFAFCASARWGNFQSNRGKWQV